MTTVQIVEKLKNEAKNNQVANDVFHVLASMKRARFIITLSGLSQRMNKDGFKHADHEYARVLRFLSELGIGKLDVNSSNKVRALKDIKTKRQNIGLVALGQIDPETGILASLEEFKVRNKYKDLIPVKKEMPAATVALTPPSRPVLEENASPIGLTVSLRGHSWTLSIPGNASNEDISKVIATLRQIKSG